MSLEIFWQLPANGDGRTPDPKYWNRGGFQGVPERPFYFTRSNGQDEKLTYFDYLVQVGRAAETSGFDGVFIPQTDEGEEPLVVAGSLVRELKRIRIAPEVPAHFLSAVYTAKIATSFQRLSGGRLVLNLVTQDPVAHSWHGYDWSEAEQTARADEFLTVFKGVWNEGPYTFEGQYYEVLNGGFAGPLKGQPQPEVFLSGASGEALALGAKHADVYILDASSPEAVAGTINRLTVLAVAEGRTLRFGLKAEIVSRHTAAEALNAYEGKGEAIADPQLVGAFDDVAERLNRYVEAGIGTLILSSYPHLEEAYRTAQHVLPRLRAHASNASIAAE